MEFKELVKRIEDLSAEDIAKYLFENKKSFDDLSNELKQNGGWDSAEKRKNVKKLITEIDVDAYKKAEAINTVEAYEEYLSHFPKGIHCNDALEKIGILKYIDDKDEDEKRKREQMLRELIENRNEYTPDEILEKLNDEDLTNIC